MVDQETDSYLKLLRDNHRYYHNIPQHTSISNRYAKVNAQDAPASGYNEFEPSEDLTEDTRLYSQLKPFT
jgi:hypothetical protein